MKRENPNTVRNNQFSSHILHRLAHLKARFQQLEKARTPGDLHHRLFLSFFILLLLQPFILFDFKNYSFHDFDLRFWSGKPLSFIFSNFRFHVLKDRVFYDVIVGEDNWLIYSGDYSIDDYQNTFPFTQEELAHIQQRLDAVEARLNAKGIKLLVVVPPNKNTIYPEKLPPEIPVIGEMSRLDQLLQHQRHHGHASILDLRPALLKARSERQIYYLTDTHWNPDGAFVGYQEIIRSLEKDFPELKPYRREDFRSVSRGSRIGDLMTIGQIIVMDEAYDLVPNFTPQYRLSVATGQNNETITYSNHEDGTLPRLVMFRDSFANWMVQYLSNHFSRATYIGKLATFTFSEKVIDQEKPDVVIIEVTERDLDFLLQLP